MYAVIGSVLTAFGLLAVALLALLFRNPAAPAWSRNELVAELFAVVVTGALGLGFAYLAMAPSQLAADGTSLAEIALAAAVLAGLVVALRLLKVRTRLRAYDAAQAATLGPSLAVANPEPTPPRTPRPRSGPPSRKAA
jgi:hypothetical protein